MNVKLTLIYWEDAISPTYGWTDINEVDSTLAECVSVGFVIKENNKTITIVSSLTGDKENTEVDGTLVLNKTWIKRREDLAIPYTPDCDVSKLIQSWLEKKNA